MSRIIKSCPHTKELEIDVVYLPPCQDTDEINSTIQSIKFGDLVSFGDNFFESLSVKLPNLNSTTTTIHLNHISNIFIPSTSFKTLTSEWKRENPFYNTRPIEGILVVFINNTKNGQGALATQFCYKYYVDRDENRSPTASIIQNEQQVNELRDLKKMKEESPQANYDDKMTSLLNSYTFVEIQCASINKLRVTRNDGFYKEAFCTFYPNSLDDARSSA